jgi:hypothetical protein
MPEPTGTSNRWKLHNDRYPSRSAPMAKAARFCGVAHAPDTGAPNPISTLPSLAAALQDAEILNDAVSLLGGK